MPESLSRRATLLRHNAGTWQGTFIRLDERGLEQERFPSALQVEEHGPLIRASLSNAASGTVRSMEFAEPPAEMQISPAGHWSLGADRIGPWPWVSELCLVQGDRRRRVVVRHSSDGLDSVVLVSEGRPGLADPPPAMPHRAEPLNPSGGLGDQAVWLLECSATSRVELQVMQRRSFGAPQAVTLRWWPGGSGSHPGTPLEIRRAHGASGLLEALA